MTGWGYAAGTLGGILLSLVALVKPDAPMYIVFPPICTASLIASVAGSWMTRPVDEKILVNFYRTVRPFGLWTPIRKKSGLSDVELSARSERPHLAVLNTLLGMVTVTGLYLFPMYLVGHWYLATLLCLGSAVIAIIILSERCGSQQGYNHNGAKSCNKGFHDILGFGLDSKVMNN